MTDAEKIAALTQQLIYWRNEAAALNQLLQASRRTGEKHVGRTITYGDPTANKACANADRATGRN